MGRDKRVLPYGEQILTGDSDSILASIYRSILMVGGVHAHSFDKMLTNYIRRTYNEASNIKDRTSLKSSLYKELMVNRFTWRVFIKGLRVLNIVDMEINIRLKDVVGNVVEIKKTIDLQEVTVEEAGEVDVHNS